MKSDWVFKRGPLPYTRMKAQYPAVFSVKADRSRALFRFSWPIQHPKTPSMAKNIPPLESETATSLHAMPDNTVFRSFLGNGWQHFGPVLIFPDRFNTQKHLQRPRTFRRAWFRAARFQSGIDMWEAEKTSLWFDPAYRDQRSRPSICKLAQPAQADSGAWPKAAPSAVPF